MKFELTEIRSVVGSVPVFRIRATRNFSDVSVGDLGGWVQYEGNLSQDGNCWIYDDAVAFEGSRVLDDARLCNRAMIFGSFVARDNASIGDFACGFGLAEMGGCSCAFDLARIYGQAKMDGNAIACGKAHIFGSATVGGNSEVRDLSSVYGSSKLSGYAVAHGLARVFLNMYLSGDDVKGTPMCAVQRRWMENEIAFFKTGDKGYCYAEE